MIRLSLRDELFDAARLVDEIDGARGHRRPFVLPMRPSGQESDGQPVTVPAHRAQQIEAGHVRQAPVDERHVGLEAALEGREQSHAIGKPLDREPAIFKLGRHGLAIESIVIDQGDPRAPAAAPESMKHDHLRQVSPAARRPDSGARRPSGRLSSVPVPPPPPRPNRAARPPAA